MVSTFFKSLLGISSKIENSQGSWSLLLADQVTCLHRLLPKWRCLLQTCCQRMPRSTSTFCPASKAYCVIRSSEWRLGRCHSLVGGEVFNSSPIMEQHSTGLRQSRCKPQAPGAPWSQLLMGREKGKERVRRRTPPGGPAPSVTEGGELQRWFCFGRVAVAFEIKVSDALVCSVDKIVTSLEKAGRRRERGMERVVVRNDCKSSQLNWEDARRIIEIKMLAPTYGEM